MDEIKIGSGIRVLMENTTNSKLTTKRDLLNATGTPHSESQALISGIRAYLENIGLNLHECENSYILRKKIFEKQNKEVKMTVSDKNKKIISVLTVLHLENKKCEFNKFKNIVEEMWADGAEIIEELKRMKYLKLEKNEMEFDVCYAWKFYVDFPDFKPLGYLE